MNKNYKIFHESYFRFKEGVLRREGAWKFTRLEGMGGKKKMVKELFWRTKRCYIQLQTW
jgi:hypothetical protein